MNEIRADRVARFLEKTSPENEAVTLDEMCQRMTGATGESETLPEIAKAWDIPYGKLMTWLMADVDRYTMYQRALEIQAHALVAETVDIADAEPAMTERGGVDAADVANRKLKIETRFRIAKHHASKVYGEKVEHQVNVVPTFNVVVNGVLPGSASQVVESGGKDAPVLDIDDAEVIVETPAEKPPTEKFVSEFAAL